MVMVVKDGGSHIDRNQRRVTVILGALVTLAEVPMAAVILVAVFTVHLPYGFGSIKLIAVTHAGAQIRFPRIRV